MSPDSNAEGSDQPYGANQWFVDELFEQYLADPSTVDPSWHDEFSQRAAGGTATEAAASSTAAAGDTAEASAAASAPTPAADVVAKKQAPQPQAKPHQAPAAVPPTPGQTPAKDQVPQQVAVSQQSPAPAQATGGADLPTQPVATAAPATAPYAAQVARTKPSEQGGEDQTTKLRGPAARVVSNMEASLQVPTATSVRAVPAKLLVDNRIVINNHLARILKGKVSFTHIIGYALVQAVTKFPVMNSAYAQVDGKPAVVEPGSINLGLAIDLAKPDGTRQLLVPNIKNSQAMNFFEFWKAYEDVVARARNNKLTADDFAGTTLTLTNPGTIGTVHSVPRLMQGQGTIIGVGAMDYPAQYAGTSEEQLNLLGISKVLTLTSTYDHRVIQGAQSGEFLRILNSLLLGEDGFYDQIFTSLRVPYEPVRWVRDNVIDPDTELGKPARLAELIHAYRSRGHFMADTDPLSYQQRRHPDLDVQNHGFTLWDLDRTFPTGGFTGKPRATLRSVLGLLRDSYCRTVGAEYMHLQDRKQRRWMQERLEVGEVRLPHDKQLRILNRLNAAEAFEVFLQTKYVGQKRFSLEGGESLIPLLDAMLVRAAESGLDEVTIGMAHRGRLNVLANIAGKSYAQIFAEFAGSLNSKTMQGSGDVKYHLGTQGVFEAPSGATTGVHIAANPSHLEAVNPVLEGIVRAKQDRLDRNDDEFSVLPVQIHGDAAFAGQGVVFETLNLSQLKGYRTGGTIHVLINNQIGFTTGPRSSRSTHYATDLAKGLQMPIFHVNGEDPEACARIAELAFEFRQEFNVDVVIDMVCYRRRGHNEGDDPSMTQPLMYELIDGKRSARKIYTDTLLARKDITEEEVEAVQQDYSAQLERVFIETRDDGWAPPVATESIAGLELPDAQLEDAGMTLGWQSATTPDVIARIGAAHQRKPEGFVVHPKLQALLDRRAKMSTEGGIDWGYAEVIAFGSLLMEGTPVRLAGQDSRRGTFVQRHAVFHDQHTGAEWTPLIYLSSTQEKFWVYDSPLSEYAALGFEYGYSVERPDALVLWEAQFGDFVNGAQTIIDEFISSAEQKWGQHSSVVMLLPHGFEGQGPDHSSARVERFLQLCAEDNMIVAYPSSPANYFHLLRTQAYNRPRRPLVVLTPKSMLRTRAAVSPISEFTSGKFRPVIGDDAAAAAPQRIKRVLLTAGKLYWELAAYRTEHQLDDVAIVRLEQLYPLSQEALSAALDQFAGAELTWVQEEPENQGAWPFLALNLPELVGRGVNVVSRPASASPATGSNATHVEEQKALVSRAFAAEANPAS